MESNIPGVAIESLRQIEDSRGAVLHMLRSDSPLFNGFGEIYFSITNPGVVKAWKRHFRQIQHFAVPVGRIRLALYDDRPGNNEPILETWEFGRPDAYCLVRIPAMVWYGFQGISACPAMIANCADIPHEPAESERAVYPCEQIPFQWPELRYE